jgi:pimeloyl-ACP methyl ester carboxylesterase
VTQASASGYVNVGDLDVYYERHGEGYPLVLLHGAFGTIESCFARLLPRLAGDFDVIAVELQGHGRTRDIDRPLRYEHMATDMVALLAALEIERAHFVGYSMGGAVGLQVSLDRPELVDRLVFAGGASFDDKNGVHPELIAAFDSFEPHDLDGSRWHEAYRRVAPDPNAWIPLAVKMNELDRAGIVWPREKLGALEVPTLLINGDADIVRPEHLIEMFQLLGGGVPGDLVGIPRARLAILPGTTHEGVVDRVDWLASMIADFLASDTANEQGDQQWET